MAIVKSFICNFIALSLTLCGGLGVYYKDRIKTNLGINDIVFYDSTLESLNQKNPNPNKSSSGESQENTNISQEGRDSSNVIPSQNTSSDDGNSNDIQGDDSNVLLDPIDAGSPEVGEKEEDRNKVSPDSTSSTPPSDIAVIKGGKDIDPTEVINEKKLDGGDAVTDDKREPNQETQITATEDEGSSDNFPITQSPEDQSKSSPNIAVINGQENLNPPVDSENKGNSETTEDLTSKVVQSGEKEVVDTDYKKESNPEPERTITEDKGSPDNISITPQQNQSEPSPNADDIKDLGASIPEVPGDRPNTGDDLAPKVTVDDQEKTIDPQEIQKTDEGIPGGNDKKDLKDPLIQPPTQDVIVDLPPQPPANPPLTTQTVGTVEEKRDLKKEETQEEIKSPVESPDVVKKEPENTEQTPIDPPKSESSKDLSSQPQKEPSPVSTIIPEIKTTVPPAEPVSTKPKVEVVPPVKAPEAPAKPTGATGTKEVKKPDPIPPSKPQQQKENAPKPPAPKAPPVKKPSSRIDTPRVAPKLPAALPKVQLPPPKPVQTEKETEEIELLDDSAISNHDLDGMKSHLVMKNHAKKTHTSNDFQSKLEEAEKAKKDMEKLGVKDAVCKVYRKSGGIKEFLVVCEVSMNFEEEAGKDSLKEKWAKNTFEHIDEDFKNIDALKITLPNFDVKSFIAS